MNRAVDSTRLVRPGATLAAALFVRTVAGVMLCLLTPRIGNCQLAATATLLQMKVDTSYSTAESLRQIDQIATFAAPRLVSVRPGDTVSAVILREYGFGEKNARAAYKAIEEIIKAKNGLADVDRLTKTVLVVPPLPRYGVAQNRPAATAEVEKVVLTSPPPPQAAAELPGLIPEISIGTFDQVGKTRHTVLHFEVSAAVTATSEFQSFLREGYVTPTAADMVVEFRQTQEQGGRFQPPLSELATALQGAQRRGVRLFVLDSGWPERAFASSRSHLWNLIDRVGAQFGVTARRTPATFKKASNHHCEQVYEALQPFEQLPGNPVETVFVPLSVDQQATETLEDLVTVSLALQKRQAMSDEGRLNLSASEKRRVLADARADAKARVARLRPTADSETFNTDKAVVDAVWLLAQAVAEEDEQTFFVVSESWTVRAGALKYEPLPSQRGIGVAAAGNVKNRNIYTEPIIDFAGRSRNSTYMLAVMNMDAQGIPKCDSSVVRSQFLASVNAVGYDGVISQDCGTSFATPRVAWLIAAGEALRSQPVSVEDWATRVNQALTRGRKGNDLSELLLNPIAFLQAMRSMQ